MLPFLRGIGIGKGQLFPGRAGNGLPVFGRNGPAQGLVPACHGLFQKGDGLHTPESDQGMEPAPGILQSRHKGFRVLLPMLHKACQKAWHKQGHITGKNKTALAVFLPGHLKGCVEAAHGADFLCPVRNEAHRDSVLPGKAVGQGCTRLLAAHGNKKLRDKELRDKTCHKSQQMLKHCPPARKLQGGLVLPHARGAASGQQNAHEISVVCPRSSLHRALLIRPLRVLFHALLPFPLPACPCNRHHPRGRTPGILTQKVQKKRPDRKENPALPHGPFPGPVCRLPLLT